MNLDGKGRALQWNRVCKQSKGHDSCYVCYNSISMQGVLEEFDDLFVAAGSAGTICGLAIAKYLSGAKIKSVAAISCKIDTWLYSV